MFDLPSRPKSRPQPHAIIGRLADAIDYLALATAQFQDADLMNLRRNNYTSLVLTRVPLAKQNLDLVCDCSTAILRPVVP